MRIKSWLASASLAATAVLLCSLPVALRAQDASSTDPVADAARRSREAKRNAPKSRKVYTDDDVVHTKPAPAAVATPADATGTAVAPGTVPTGAAAVPANSSPNAEAAWRKRFQDQRDKIARAEKELDILQRETQKAQIQYYPDPQKALNEQYTRKEINDKEAKVDAKRQEIAQLKQGLSDLEDELRKAGGDSGWSR